MRFDGPFKVSKLIEVRLTHFNILIAGPLRECPYVPYSKLIYARCESINLSDVISHMGL